MEDAKTATKPDMQAEIFVPLKLLFDPETGEARLEMPNELPSISSVDTRAYISISEASKRLGVSYEMVSEWTNRANDPLPYIRSGRKKLVRASCLEEYALRREETI